MPWLDLILALPLIWGMYRGFNRGFIIEICTLMALALGLYGASLFGEGAGEYLAETINTDERLSLVLAFTLVFVMIVVVIILFGKMLEGAVKMTAMGPVNKISGLLFGGFKFALIISALLFALEGIWLQRTLIPSSWKQDSYLYHPVAALVPKIYPILKDKSWSDRLQDKIIDVQDEPL